MENLFRQSLVAIVGMLVIVGDVGAQSSSPANTQSVGPNIQLPSEVLERLKPITMPKASSVLRGLKVDLVADSTIRPAIFYFEPEENGLWAVALIVPFPKRANVMRSITLQGLIRLTLTLDLIGEFDVPLLIPGKAFIPFAGLPLFRSTVTTSSVRKTTSLSGDLTRLTAPTPGVSFTYVNAFEVQTTGKGMFTTSTSAKVEVTGECVTATESKEATMLHPKLKGSFLAVSCEERRGQTTERQEYAYLVESALYVLLSAADAQGKKTSYNITDVEYSE